MEMKKKKFFFLELLTYKHRMNIHLKILLVFIRLVNLCFSPIGYRLLHSANAIAFGLYKFGNKIWLLVYFILYALILELLVTPWIYNPKKYYRNGCEIIAELREEIKRRKEQKSD
jgi:hypothetical protein